MPGLPSGRDQPSMPRAQILLSTRWYLHTKGLQGCKMFSIEHEFELPKGYVDAEGNLHRRGLMRLATAADEILPMKDPRVRDFSAYLVVILLSRVVIKLGALREVNPGVIEGLFTEDLSYLQQ